MRILRFVLGRMAFVRTLVETARDRAHEEEGDDVGEDDRDDAAGRTAADIEVKQARSCRRGRADWSTRRLGRRWS